MAEARYEVLRRRYYQALDDFNSTPNRASQQAFDRASEAFLPISIGEGRPHDMPKPARRTKEGSK